MKFHLTNAGTIDRRYQLRYARNAHDVVEACWPKARYASEFSIYNSKGYG